MIIARPEHMEKLKLIKRRATLIADLDEPSAAVIYAYGKLIFRGFTLDEMQMWGAPLEINDDYEGCAYKYFMVIYLKSEKNRRTR